MALLQVMALLIFLLENQVKETETAKTSPWQKIAVLYWSMFNRTDNFVLYICMLSCIVLCSAQFTGR